MRRIASPGREDAGRVAGGRPLRMVRSGPFPTPQNGVRPASRRAAPARYACADDCVCRHANAQYALRPIRISPDRPRWRIGPRRSLKPSRLIPHVRSRPSRRRTSPSAPWQQQDAAMNPGRAPFNTLFPIGSATGKTISIFGQFVPCECAPFCAPSSGASAVPVFASRVGVLKSGNAAVAFALSPISVCEYRLIVRLMSLWRMRSWATFG